MNYKISKGEDVPRYTSPTDSYHIVLNEESDKGELISKLESIVKMRHLRFKFIRNLSR